MDAVLYSSLAILGSAAAISLAYFVRRWIDRGNW